MQMAWKSLFEEKNNCTGDFNFFSALGSPNQTTQLGGRGSLAFISKGKSPKRLLFRCERCVPIEDLKESDTKPGSRLKAIVCATMEHMAYYCD